MPWKCSKSLCVGGGRRLTKFSETLWLHICTCVLCQGQACQNSYEEARIRMLQLHAIQLMEVQLPLNAMNKSLQVLVFIGGCCPEPGGNLVVPPAGLQQLCIPCVYGRVHQI